MHNGSSSRHVAKKPRASEPLTLSSLQKAKTQDAMRRLKAARMGKPLPAMNKSSIMDDRRVERLGNAEEEQGEDDDSSADEVDLFHSDEEDEDDTELRPSKMTKSFGTPSVRKPSGIKAKHAKSKVTPAKPKSKGSRTLATAEDESWIVDDDGAGYADDQPEEYSFTSSDEDETERKHKKPQSLLTSASKAKSTLAAKKMVESKTVVPHVATKPLNEFFRRGHTAKASAKANETFESVTSDIFGESADSVRFLPVRKTKASDDDFETMLMMGSMKDLSRVVSSTTGEAARHSDDISNMSRTDENELDENVLPDFDVDVEFDQNIDPLSSENDSSRSGSASQRSSDIKMKVLTENTARMNVSSPSVSSAVNLDVPDSSGWLSVADEIVEDEVPDPALQELLSNVESKSLRMFWIDLFDDKRGNIYLLGKVADGSSFVSGCVVVPNIMRCVHFLLRERDDGNLLDTHDLISFFEIAHPDETTHLNEEAMQEIVALMKKHRIQNYKMRPVTKDYAFELPDVPKKDGKYMQVLYPFSFPALSPDCTGRTFCRIFGTGDRPTEQFLIGRKLYGPCWLDITEFKETTDNSKKSWCRKEFSVDGPIAITVAKITSERPPPSPPVVVMSLSLKTVLNDKTHTNEIVMASAAVHSRVNIDGKTPNQMPQSFLSIIRKRNASTAFPSGFEQAANSQKHRQKKVLLLNDENALLTNLLAYIDREDPDVLVGHNIIGFDLDVLLHRMKDLRVNEWSKLGRLRRTTMPKLQAGAGGSGDSTFEEKEIVAGRLLCDTYLAAKSYVKSSSYSLNTLAGSQLSIIRDDLEIEKISAMFLQSKSLLYLLHYSQCDVELTMKLMHKMVVLPLTKQLTNLAGNLWIRTLTGGRAEQNEALLLHEFSEKNFICPDRQAYGKRPKVSEADGEEDAEKSKGKKASYSGGLVLAPKTGLYEEYILLLDFNSLYPSIIQEYNICFTTVQRQSEEQMPEVPESEIETGILPKIIRSLVERRKTVKNMMGKCTDSERAQLDIRQKALKLTANSMYGCLGFASSRFYAKPLAMLITSKGREILQNTVDLVEKKLSFEVIYGDTDSIMVNTHSTEVAQVRTIGKTIKDEVNKCYKLLEIEMDGIFQRMLLYKKKKYAAVVLEEKNGVVTTSTEIKGLDIVRREWCELSKQVQKYVLDQMLSSTPREEVISNIITYLQALGKDIRDLKYPVSKFIIRKQLSKLPEHYSDAKIQPHVQVALRMRQKNLSIKAQDVIEYVIAKSAEEVEDVANDSTGPSAAKPTASSSAAAKARMVAEVKLENLDVDWYLYTQFYPPIERLCEPLKDIDGVQVAESLGLDTKKYHIAQHHGGNHDDEPRLVSRMSSTERFKHANPWIVTCRLCKGKSTFTKASLDKGEIKCGLYCTECKEQMPTPSLAAQLRIVIREHIRKYYDSDLKCDDCHCETRQLCSFGRYCAKLGCPGTMTPLYSEADLYTQLTYYKHLFEIDDSFSKSKENTTDVEAFQHTYGSEFSQLQAVVESYLNRSEFRFVDFSQLFQFAMTL